MRELMVVAGVVLGVGCGEPATEEVVAAITPEEGQGQDWQGQDWQGQDWQGQDWQGQDWQGVQWDGMSFAGVLIGTTPATEVSLSMTELTVWKSLGKAGWQQRLPDRICGWNATRTTMTGCTIVDLDTQPSPLAGTNWRATFRRPNGTTFVRTIRIGQSSSEIGAVRKDDKLAMHPLNGHTSRSGVCEVVHDPARCDNPAGCRVNCDLWLYDLWFAEWDQPGVPKQICSAMPFGGIWNAQGTAVADSTRFTFACTTGVITKCARWGYRPSGSSIPPGQTSRRSLSPYHQACVRAAAADYCGVRHSFTRNGTLVDIYDHDFVPRAMDLYSHVTGLAWESGFAPDGAFMMDHMRYEEAVDERWESPDGVCPGRFTQVSDDVGCPTQSETCMIRTVGWGGPAIWVDSARACAHTEQTVGKWLNAECNGCVRQVYPYCRDAHDPRGWDAACVARAAAVCNGATMASHAECSTGAPLGKFDTGCTLAVCLDPANASCCDPNGAWSAACVAAVNAKCTGGREGYYRIGLHDVWYGFCGGPNSDPLPPHP